MTEATAPISSDEESFFHALAEASPTALVVIDSDGRIIEMNSKTEQLFGQARQRLLGERIEKLVRQRLKLAHPAYVKAYVRQPEARPMGAGRELFGLHADGREIPLEIEMSPFETRDGLFSLASMIDISERRRAEADRALLAAIVSSSDDVIISNTGDGIVLSWNAAAAALFGRDSEEMIGQSIAIIIPADRIAEERDLRERAKAGEHIGNFETQRLRRDGSLIDVAMTLSPLCDPRGEIVGASSILRDITSSRQCDQELLRSNAEQEHFAYVASHDLQEPLRMVANYVELLAGRYRGKLDERADKYIYFASDGARRMQQLVSDLPAYSHVGSQGGPMAPVDMAEILANVTRSLDAIIRETGATIEAQPLPIVQGDAAQLGQLLQNLIGNAIKFGSDAPPRIRIEAKQCRNDWTFSVRDNGIGVDMRFADRIFQMFERLNERDRYDGSGMGLAIAKRIVERHGGTISIVSQPGIGTDMCFTLHDNAKDPRS